MNEKIVILEDNLHQQAAKYREMLIIAQKQLEEVEDPAFPKNLSQLSEVLEHRQILMKEIKILADKASKLEADLAQFCGLEEFLLRDFNGLLTPEELGRLSEAFRELGQVMFNITEVDERLETTMRAKLGLSRSQRVINPDQAIEAYKKAAKKKK